MARSSRPSGRKADKSVDFTLRALKVFVAVEEAGSMIVAAERLCSSASGVSQQISNLEKTVGARLFDRSAKPIALTPAGHLLRQHARRILESVSAAQTAIMELNLNSLVELRLAIIDDLDASITPDLAAHLKSLYPSCLFSAWSGRSDHATDALQNRQADIAITADPPVDTTIFEIFPLLREPFILVTAKAAIDESQNILQQLMNLPYVHYGFDIPIGRMVEQHFRRIRLSPQRHYAFDASRSVLAMINKCGGWTLTTPLNYLDGIRFKPNLDVMPLPFASFSRDIFLVARRGELGDLPETLARLSTDLIGGSLLQEAVAIAPWAEGGFRVYHTEDVTEPEMAAAVSAAD